jgi:hypothetical protein
LSVQASPTLYRRAIYSLAEGETFVDLLATRTWNVHRKQFVPVNRVVSVQMRGRGTSALRADLMAPDGFGCRMTGQRVHGLGWLVNCPGAGACQAAFGRSFLPRRGKLRTIPPPPRDAVHLLSPETNGCAIGECIRRTRARRAFATALEWHE